VGAFDLRPAIFKDPVYQSRMVLVSLINLAFEYSALDNNILESKTDDFI
jgi:hypothetical protein